MEKYRSEALTSARRAVDLNPSLYDAHVALALASRESGQLDGWRTEATRAIEINPRLAEGYAVLGDTYYASPVWGCGRDRDTALADEYYRKALEIDPRLEAAHSNRAGSLRWGGRAQDALKAADEGRRILPASSVIRRQRAETLLALNVLDEAEADLRAAIEGHEPSAIELMALGFLDLQRGRTAEAALRFDKALAIFPLVAYRVLIGHYYAVVRRADLAVPHLAFAFEVDRACADFVRWSPAFAGYRDAPPIADLIGRYRRTD